MTRRPRLVRVGVAGSSGTARPEAARVRCDPRSCEQAGESPRGREDRRRRIRRPCSRSGGRDAAHRDSCPFPGRPGATTDRCCRETTRRRAPRRPAIRHHHPHATPQGRPRSSPRLPRAADRTPAAASAVAEALRTDRPEQARRRRLQRHEPTQGSQARLDIGGRAGRDPGNDQGLGQTRIVVGKPFLEPHPVLGLDRRHDGHQPVGKEQSDALGNGILRRRRRNRRPTRAA